MENAVVVKSKISHIENSSESNNDQYHGGSVLTYVCKDGYSLQSGDLTRICGQDGIWLGNSALCGMLIYFFTYASHHI